MGNVLTPEGFHRLQVRLDRLRATSERCRRALAELADGKVSDRDFAVLLEEQRAAHRAWVRENEEPLADA